ncbi:MAG: hypothetical protein SGJ23_05625 [Alphaproteobacteria bacterium]|nr:hypothetical protein [Alphaproteobacteria bacterium]
MRKLHRSLGWLAGVAATFWALTGFLHPIMTWSAPRPALQAPPSAAVSLDGIVAPVGSLPAQAHLLRLVEHQGRRYRQAMTSDGVTAVQNVHTLKFLEGVEPLRVALIALLVGSVLATTLIGMSLLVGSRGRGVRIWHRRLAWGAAPFLLAFTISGLFHLFATSALTPPGSAALFRIADIVAMPRIEGVDRSDVSAVAGANGMPLWRVLPQGSEVALYFDGEGRALPTDDALRARVIAGSAETAPVVQISRFSADYGFVNKRLPVMQVGEGASATFVDLREGLIAARATPGAVAFEGWFFDTIHKWEPVAELIGRRTRDYLTMIAVALIAVMASFGLVLAANRRRKGEVQ